MHRDEDILPYEEIRDGNVAALHDWLARGGQIDMPLLPDVAENWTPLMLACAEGDSKLARILIDSGGARPSLRIGSKIFATTTALHVACRYGHHLVASILVELGAVVDARDTVGMTSLHYASANGHIRTMEVLLSAGADALAKGPGGGTSLDFAEMAGLKDASALLTRWTPLGEEAIAKRNAVATWLKMLACEQFLGRFLKAGFDDLQFMAAHGLTDADLDCVGVPIERLGLRKKLLAMHGVESILSIDREEKSSVGRDTERASATVISTSTDESDAQDDDSTSSDSSRRRSSRTESSLGDSE